MRQRHASILDAMAVLRLFGHPVLEHGDRRAALSITPKAVALIALAAANAGRALSRDGLAQRLWPDEEIAQARANLRRQLHLISKALGDDALIVTRQTVQWNPSSGIAVDAVRFDAGAQTEPSAAAKEYAGEFCAGIDEPALDELRLRYRAQYEHVLHRLIAGCRQN